MSFADSFWTQDYNLGFKVLFEELYQGANENEDFISLFNKRMEIELIYGNQLVLIKDSKSVSSRYTNDDYISSVKNAYFKINENFNKQGEYHLQVANNIKVLVLEPFTKWSKEHKQRIDYSNQVIQDHYKVFKNAKIHLDRLQKKYFNKCRMLEEFKSHYTDEELSSDLNDLQLDSKIEKVEEDHGAEENEEEEENDTTYTFGNAVFDYKTLKKMLTDILTNIELIDHKVPILGTYNNVSTGSNITQWLLDNIPEFNGNIAKAESFGQDLINNGFIRLIGSMSGGKNFINSSQFYYQWKPLVFQITKLSDSKIINNDSNGLSRNNSINLKSSNNFADYFEDMKQAIGVNSIDYNDKAQLLKIIQDVNQLDHQYYQSILELDNLRCKFEELIMDHLTFMQKCELDRLKAIKKVTFDFLASFSNKINSMKHLCDELLILEETINPVNDLKFLIENYSTGFFKPHVILYDNYYNSNIKQTFGVSLNVKSRLDHKVVPIIIQCILSHLDNIYPDIINDEERINLWTKPIHLSNVHQLRFQLNDVNDPNKINEILKTNHPLTVTNVLKLYFMELPDAIIPHNYYDLIKSLYQNYPINSNDSKIDDSRINGLQNVLVDLPKSNLATLDALLTHLNRLVNIIGSKDESLSNDFKKKLSKEFGNIILRPRMDNNNLYNSSDLGQVSNNNLNGFINEQHQILFINDLFNHKEVIFKELRRRNSTRVDGLSNSSSLKNSSKNASLKKKNASPNNQSRLEAKMKKAVNKSKISPKSNNSESSTSASNSIPNSISPGTSRGRQLNDDPVDDDDEILVADDDNNMATANEIFNRSPLMKETLAEAVSTHSTPTIKRTGSTVLPEPPATPPPHSPTKKASAPGSLKRGQSPNKKKTNSSLSEVSNNKQVKSASSSIVSSRPLKRDIIYNHGNNSEYSSPNGSSTDVSQPKFASSIGRKTSVKDMASRFDSPSPPSVPAKDNQKPKNNGKSGDDAIVVE
ncbi:hypothetical protein HYPBUDRAFT_235816 [Hyphopichia burtonii NRRL Y-1933]|uniref:Rho-GAP domain-containing protein n=1 Tax=Hyphopichia burtonii NRRL Y-1933 TaxID=984485 RepID=A0A1E4RPX5_9ASCO|nr:hypothetical protein HYPBUDRAFT_235816 [Hyphopichia burtonii NRRL Y-1933]ODV69317.1 hypothetical protein HYPBUDRAFT_235816 [Hyphopichia burtonii NRRL Y-1933]